MARFSGEAQQEHQRDFLREKYLDYPPDLIIAVSGAAVAFLMQYRASLFTGVPVVYLTWQGEGPPKDLPDSKAAGISTTGRADATLRLALDLQPDTRHIAVVTGSSQRDNTLAEEARTGSSAFKNRVDFTWLMDLSLPKLRDELARLPDHTVVLYLTLFQDAAGNRFTPQEALDRFAPASRVPIYGYYDTYLGHGIVGGSMVTFEDIGRETAQAAVRILGGESPQDVARSEIARPIPMFDWHELRRWNISGKQLPPSSVVLFKEATYWEKHYWLILGVVSASVVEALLIAVLIVQLRRRRQAESFLRESEERLNLATTSAGAGLWALDQTSRQIWLTDRARQLFGLSAGKGPAWVNLLSAIHPDDREHMQNSVEEALRTGKEFKAEFRVVGTNGSARWISSRGRTQFGSHVKLQRLMGACVDITERKQAEAEARQHREQLAHLSRVAIMGEIAGTLAHELNQPLTGIVANGSAGRRFIAKGRADLAKLDGLFEVVVADGCRAGEIIRGIRSMVRKGEEVRCPVNLNEVMASVLRFVGSDALERDCALVTEPDVKLPLVEADQVQLQQVLLNLVVNAFDAMSKTPASERRVIIRSERKSDGRVRVSVRDFGTGLPAGEPERIFEQFFSTKRDGMGMGLAIARSIIASHGGELAAANAQGGGACVHFSLPVIAGAKEDESRQSEGGQEA
ncbi:MAG TPA: ATP-binding protein [Silvibacterium sp.]|nr:ATP-binding protein [Silvibacterium sp.]